LDTQKQVYKRVTSMVDASLEVQCTYFSEKLLFFSKFW